jgi:glycosyltransferase involved in cell wall biosynthesis
MSVLWNQPESKRALVCSFHVAQADRDSGSRRTFDFLRFLVEAGWTVTFFAADGVGNEQDAHWLRQRGVPVYDASMVDLADLVKACGFDLAVMAFWANGERYLPIIRQVSPRTHVIIDSVDVHFVRETRQAFQREPLADSFLQDKHADHFVRELNTYAAADGVLTVSDKEANLINDLIGDFHLAHVAPDGEALEPSPVPFHERKGVLFVGSFQHEPNVDAVEYLCKEVLPRVDPGLLAEHPLSIVGNALTDRVRDVARDVPGVQVIGWVPSVEPYFASARISVVPLRYGAGTKRKLIQALMIGTPTVSTTIGVEGLNVCNEEHVLIGDDPGALATAMMRLLTDGELWARLASKGRAHLGPLYHIEGARQRFLDAVNATLLTTPKKAPGWSTTRTRLFDGYTARKFQSPSESGPSERMNQVRYQELIRKIRTLVRASVPADATVAVISKGDPMLLELDGRWTWHFPQDKDGNYAGYYPANGVKAVEHLEAVRRKGAEFLVIPSTGFWWLEYYHEFKEHLNNCCVEVARAEDVCIIFCLRETESERPHFDLAESRGEPVSVNRFDRIPIAALPQDSRSPVVTGRPADVAGGETGVRLIAFYLPQFHPIPENNEWWGEGFTEWRSVAKADPLFPGHYQPHIPADLGFYDLRCEDTREQQTELAKEHGVDGFCYYHYWFEGKRLLERPFEVMLALGRPDFPFCLCWANDPWSRKWNGRTQDLLQEQTYSPQDDLNHIRWLLAALGDRRAIQVDGKPLFLVYRGKELPDAIRTTDCWREEVRKAGLKGIYLVAVETAWDLGWDATQVGFDAKVLFQPQFGQLINAGKRIAIPGKDRLQVHDYATTWRMLASLPEVSYPRFDTVFPGWDNSPRVGENAVVIHDADPAEYRAWLRHALQKASQQVDPKLVFINAWNEWAEGCHLEPDQRDGRGFLEATRIEKLRLSAACLSRGKC